ncbi:hypothetical protein D3C75_1170050 [compost metagenome]
MGYFSCQLIQPPILLEIVIPLQNKVCFHMINKVVDGLDDFFLGQTLCQQLMKR